MNHHKKSNYKNPFSATWEGISAIFKKQQKVGQLNDDERLDGKTVFIDGASSGLGFAVASQVAARGAKVVMAVRSGIPEKGEEVRNRSGNPDVHMVHVDYSDVDSIGRLVQTLKEQFAPFDIVILNAAMVPRQSRKTKQGLEEMFMVNYLSKFILLNALVEHNCFNTRRNTLPRIVIVSSESHRHPDAYDWAGFGKYKEYGMQKTVEYYGYYKLLLTTFAFELSRRLNPNGHPSISVFSLCPGPVNSGIARETPGIFQPVLKAVFALFFKAPDKAAEPVLYLACSRDLEGKPFDYLFRMTRKEIDAKAAEEENGERLWEISKGLADKIRSGGSDN